MWQPIETFQAPPFDPKSWYLGTTVLVVQHGHVTIGRYSYTLKGKGRWQNAYGRIIAPTHWMPLPEPPK